MCIVLSYFLLSWLAGNDIWSETFGKILFNFSRPILNSLHDHKTVPPSWGWICQNKVMYIWTQKSNFSLQGRQIQGEGWGVTTPPPFPRLIPEVKHKTWDQIFHVLQIFLQKNPVSTLALSIDFVFKSLNRRSCWKTKVRTKKWYIHWYALRCAFGFLHLQTHRSKESFQIMVQLQVTLRKYENCFSVLEKSTMNYLR